MAPALQRDIRLEVPTMKPAFAFFLVCCIALAATAQTKSANNSQDPRAQEYVEQAMKMFYAGDLHGSIEMLRKAIDLGSPEAEMELGWRYEGGYGVPQDFKQAFYWYDQSAKHHYAKGARALGGLYFFGKGVRQDYSMALPLYEVGGWAGDHLAQYQLGYMYEHGLGVQADLNSAFQWYAKAAPDDHYPNARQGEDEMLRKLSAQRFVPIIWLFQLLNSSHMDTYIHGWPDGTVLPVVEAMVPLGPGARKLLLSVPIGVPLEKDRQRLAGNPTAITLAHPPYVVFADTEKLIPAEKNQLRQYLENVYARAR